MSRSLIFGFKVGLFSSQRIQHQLTTFNRNNFGLWWFNPSHLSMDSSHNRKRTYISSSMDVDMPLSSSQSPDSSTATATANTDPVSTTNGINRTVKIGLVQMTSTGDVHQNIDVCNQLIEEAYTRDAKMVFLPEAFDFISENKEQGKKLADTLEGMTITNFKDMAKELGLWISLGGFHEKRAEADMEDKEMVDQEPWMRNSHILINNLGFIVGKYDKIHLFSMDSPTDDVVLNESASVEAGSKLCPPVDTPIGKLGLGICYDLRFPEFSLRLRQAGADVLTFPSAFTVPTGKAHWESLLRARAIENQCFVIAAAQYGQHNNKRSTYGHSMVVDPWGTKIAEASDKSPQLLMADIDLDVVNNVRQKMPVLKHRKPGAYGLEPAYCIIPSDADSENTFVFGQVIVKNQMTFLEQDHGRAFVNKKCVLPGHVLVTSKRPVTRLGDLTPVEISDIFQLVQRVEKIMEEIYSASSSTVVIQDGKDAGQSIRQVHVHIVPRQPMDALSNDSIYTKLAEHDKGENIVWRDENEMNDECRLIRNHVLQHHQDWLTTKG